MENECQKIGHTKGIPDGEIPQINLRVGVPVLESVTPRGRDEQRQALRVNRLYIVTI
jgi:hypothetical protein